ncbi:uncharacterized protein LOC119189297 [Manduca sexta]|uniref:uncharacterized protein LOC119189297 n=1 Tax=Manduca sexta TaxID=7130 RepID=UPI00188FB3CE|nr:uncharacterized protein LOC119189297 [Manduca sexta]
MRLYIVLLMSRFLCEAQAYLETENFPFNVGTVLFTHSDTKRNRWSKKEIALLRARRNFQSLIPHLNMINTQNEKYVDSLLNYWKNAYISIKREAPNPEADSIMTTALSDVIGGYLKVRALPVTKFSFYGGSTSEDDAVKLFKFHDEIKNYMGTHGKGWKDADPNVLNSVAINIPSKRDSKVRSMSHPCEHLAYYEKTPTGLSIPTPFINWDDKTKTMFIPLKNYSLIPLESQNATNALFRYYDVAKNCIGTSSQAEQDNFDQRFQTWLTDDVVPHLADDRLYLALGSVLTLVNTTRSLYDTVVNLYNNCATECRHKFSIGGFPVDMCSKKVIVITVILFLEIAWCIPALLYIMCKKRKKDGCSNVYLFVEPKPEKKNFPKERLKLEKAPRPRQNKRDISVAPSIVEMSSSEQMMFSTTPKSRNVGTKQSSVCKCSTGTGVQSFFSSKVNSTEVARVIYDSPMPSLKSSLKKVPSDKIEVIKAQPNIFQQSSSIATMQRVQPKTVTLKHNDKPAKIGTQTSNRGDKYKKICDNNNKICVECPCVACLEDECVAETKRQRRVQRTQNQTSHRKLQ